MSKIIKKISASLILILMLFSVSFNVISYAADINDIQTVISGKFKLKLSNDLYLQITEQEWQNWLSNYNNYYSYLKAFTGCDPLSETGNSYITIDATSNSIKTYAYYHTYENGKWDCTIFIRESILEIEINKIKNNIGSSDSYTLIHELGHAFQYKYNMQGAYAKNWCFNAEVMKMIEAAYVQQMAGINTLYYANLTTFNDCKIAYVNQMYGHDTGYNNYYWLAGKLLTLKDSSSLSSFASIINSGKVSGSTFANKFNTFIDAWEEITGEDIWNSFSKNDISTIESTLDGTIGTLKDEKILINTVTFQQINNEKTGLYITSKGNGANLTVELDGIKDINEFRSKVKGFSVSLEGFREGTTLSVKDNNKLEISLIRDVNEQLDIKSYKGSIAIYYLNNEGVRLTLQSYFDVQVVATDNDLFISNITFQQKENSNAGIFDEALIEENEESKTATITVEIKNISEDTDMTNLSIKITSLEGFETKKVTFKGYDKKTKIATYEIQVEYQGLLLDDLENEKYINCEIKAIVNKKTITKTIQIEVQNLDEEEEEYKYSYGQVDETDSKIHYTKFEVKDEITIKGENEAVVYIKIIGEDISEKHLVIENTTYDKAGKYVNGGTRYEMRFTKSGTYKAILDGTEIATITVEITENPEIKYVYVFDYQKTGINTVTDSKANKAKTDREHPNDEIGTNSSEINWVIEDLNEKDSNGEFIKYYCYDANDGLAFQYIVEKYQLDENGNYTYDNYHRDHNGQLIPIKYKEDIRSYYKYKSKENIELDNTDMLILAFLQKVSEEEAKKINGGSLPGHWRENAIQYYIWNEITNTSKNIGYGKLRTLIEELKISPNNYIDFENKTITLDEKTYKVKDYKAVKFIVEGKYDSENGEIIAYEPKNLQPLITFDVELEEGGGIQLQKSDEQGNPLEATFIVLEEKKAETWYKLDEYTTNSETGLTETIPTKSNTKYAIFETKAPEGYTPTKQYAIVEVDQEGNCTYKIYEVSEENLNKDGYINIDTIKDGNGEEEGKEYIVNKDFIEDGTEVEDIENADWNSGEVKADGKVDLLLVLTNKSKIPSLKIIKVDQDGVKIGNKGGKFEITVTSKDGQGNIVKTEILDKNGEINLSLIEEKITGTKLEITVKEIEPPKGYEQPEITEITFTVEYTEENEWEITELAEEEGFKVDIVNSVIQIQITNKKKKDIELQIQKEDESGMPLSGAGFVVECSGLEGLSGSLTSGEDGKTSILTAKKENIKPGTYTVTITETTTPDGYEPIEKITFKITVKKDGKITVTSSSNALVTITTQTTEDTLKIIVTIKNKKEEEETTKKSGLELPLIMTISGQVWLDQPQGKNSETNGLCEKDEELEGITVKVYESDGVTPAKLAETGLVKKLIDNAEAKQYLGEYYSQIEYKIGFIPDEPVVKTDSRGLFIISGLDPAKYYTLVFEYNGMRYSEIKASIKIEGCGTPEIIASTTTAQTVQEDEDRRKEITEMFSEIGPYPNNYSGGLVFTQTEVEKYIQTGEVPTGATSGDIENFIANTTITAKIENLGGILSECENSLRGYNLGLGSKSKIEVQSSYVFPVVIQKNKGTVKYTAGTKEAVEQELMLEIQEYVDSYYDNIISNFVGYRVQAHEKYDYLHWTVLKHNTGHQSTKPELGEYRKGFHYYSYLIKDEKNKKYDPPQNSNGTSCGEPLGHDENGVEQYCSTRVGQHEYYTLKEGIFTTYYYFVDEGYSNYVEEDNTNHTRISVWDTANEPLYDYDKISGKSGEINGEWGWQHNLTGIDDNNLENDAKEGIGKLFAELDSKINSKSPTSPVTDLCLVYMPTVDLGLYDDVQKAVVTINGQEEKYIYDKRVANGGTFQFGVNEYDINNSSNNPSNIKEVEQAYADYYQSLTEGTPDPGESKVTSDPYEDIGIRKEDVNINLTGNESKTDTGSATAGYYNDYEVKIEMVYRIKLYNQAAVSAHVTSIWDYYQDTFEFDGVYSDADCTQPMSVSVKDATNKQIAGYKVKEINLGSIDLKGNSSYEIFIKLHMTNPKITLGGDVLDAGYATWNYAEISGYGTKIGVIDIDSTPGDLIPEERFQNGPYDDDEGKSPTLIFKNPENASRTISGIMFEDITGKTEVKTYVGETREGDGKYTSEQDKPIKGATVQLIEVTETGEPLNSPNNYETGVRAETITKDDGTYEFNKVVASNYIVRFKYGNNYQTVLTTLQGYTNENSYNGESYENTIRDTSLTGEYWYTNAQQGTSYIEDDTIRRTEVTNNFANLTNENAEILSSWKDTNPVTTLVDQLIEKGNMYAETERMLLDVEYHPRYENKIVETEGNGTYEKTYIMGNINGGIVERERAELQITKKVSEISIVDSTGKEITGGKAGEEIKYVKWIQGAGGFLDLEIDSELLSGATLKITYAITVTNNSETSTKNPNTISSIQVIDYVSNNLNYDNSYGNNSNQGWKPITTENVKNYVNNTSLNNNDLSNKIDLSTYQTILITTFGNISAGKSQTKTLTLEKNLSSQEDSNFNYENQVEIVQSYNANGRGDYSSIYGNLDPTTYTSRQGNLNWDKIETANQNGFPQQLTDTTVRESGVEIKYPNAIRLAEKDSGNAEEVIITPPTGAKGIVLETQHYILAITFLTTLAVTIILIKKYISLSKQ